MNLSFDCFTPYSCLIWNIHNEINCKRYFSLGDLSTYMPFSAMHSCLACKVKSETTVIKFTSFFSREISASLFGLDFFHGSSLYGA